VTKPSFVIFGFPFPLFEYIYIWLRMGKAFKSCKNPIKIMFLQNKSSKIVRIPLKLCSFGINPLKLFFSLLIYLFIYSFSFVHFLPKIIVPPLSTSHKNACHHQREGLSHENEWQILNCFKTFLDNEWNVRPKKKCCIEFSNMGSNGFWSDNLS
jgi:hypothetical protein